MTKTSKLSGFYKLSPEERLKIVKEFAGLSEEETTLLKKPGVLDLEQANRMIENVIGTTSLPFGIATNFRINGKEHLIPMAIEEPSVVAAASNAAKMALPDGFKAETTDPVMIGQIQLMNCKDPEKAKQTILDKKQEIINFANEQDKVLLKFGGGVKDIEVKILDTELGKAVLTHLLVDCRDAMGANAVNTMCEALAPKLESWTGGKAYLRIISNLADKRIVRASATFSKKALGGEGAVDAIINAYALAAVDPYRACTHNKGVMNGVDAVVIATGNDFRAVEAGAHAYASMNGSYKPLTKYEKNSEGDLVGTLEMPLAIGTIGGATKTHPIAKIAIKILGVKGAQELAQIIGAVGLAQNLAALKALSTEGIQRGHMELHARNVAINAGAEGKLIDKVAEQMVKEKKINAERAKELLKELE